MLALIIYIWLKKNFCSRNFAKNNAARFTFRQTWNIVPSVRLSRTRAPGLAASTIDSIPPRTFGDCWYPYGKRRRFREM